MLTIFAKILGFIAGPNFDPWPTPILRDAHAPSFSTAWGNSSTPSSAVGTALLAESGFSQVVDYDHLEQMHNSWACDDGCPFCPPISFTSKGVPVVNSFPAPRSERPVF